MFRHARSRGLTTLLFTDIAGSSEIAVELGDHRWQALQARHHAEVRRQLKRHGGREVDTAGDGFFATFDTPASGVRCAAAIVKAMRELGLEVRAGLHIGEAELTGEKASGIAVTTAARVSAMADPGQVLVTSTIVQMVAGSGLEFSDLGTRELKGVPGTWDLFGLIAADGQPVGIPLDPKDAAGARNRSSPADVPKRSLRRALPLGLVGVLVVVLAGAMLFHRGRSGSPAVSQTSPPISAALVVLDEGSGKEAHRVPLPGPRPGFPTGPIVLTGRADSPTAFAWVQYGAGQAWSGWKINRTIGVIVGQFPGKGLGNSTECTCLASAEGRIWYPASNGKLVTTQFNAYNGTSLQGIGIEGEPEKNILVDKALDPGGIGALVSGAGYLWVGDTATDQVYRVDPRPTGEVRAFPLRQGADVLAFADGSLWVLDTLEGKLTRVDPKDGHSRPSFTIPGDLHGVAVGGGYVWVTDASGNQIVRIPEDLESAYTPISVGQIAGRPEAIAYDDGAIVVGFGGGTLARINPSNPSSPMVIWTHQVGIKISSIIIDRSTILVAGGPL